ncbi:MAG: hypothetical protein CL946_01045 [Ectothiorhodospiraceae bacterium]|nr:hypothetical protein [Ectothiorhodospiraceae bacterium]
MKTSELVHIAKLSELALDETCIAIADENLPQKIRDAFPLAITVEAGERLKSLASIERLAEQILARRATKPLTLVAVGGGSVGDAVGFLASTLWRGVGLWHIPTTLLAMVDSAHGGKTGVNLANAKNQLGTFYPADKVFIVAELLETLPYRQRREGMAEVFKVALLNPDLDIDAFGVMERMVYAPFADVQHEMMVVIQVAILTKLKIVKEDPFEESGTRTLLNLGHTIGHAIERVYGINHGEAVAWGLASMLHVSEKHGLPSALKEALLARLHPLLVPLRPGIDAEMLFDTLRKDKKRRGGKLRSVLLRSIGNAYVTDTVSEDEWLDAFAESVKWFSDTRVRVQCKTPRAASITVESSKSELNRALIIAALRKGITRIEGKSSALDVQEMVTALDALGAPLIPTTAGWETIGVDASNSDTRSVHCGEGGTTLRFLIAYAASQPGKTRLNAVPALLRRPHGPLIEALRNAGARIEQTEDGFTVQGWENFPLSFTVDGSDSSQYVSALSLLAAGAPHPFTIRIEGSAVSKPYLEMTLALLERAGVEVLHEGAVIALNPTPKLERECELTIAPDASSLAVWRVTAYLGHPGNAAMPKDTLQPDSRIDEYLGILKNETAPAIDLRNAPDLLPVLSIAALRTGKTVRFTGIGHLRHKESNRIEGLQQSLQAVGIRAEAEEHAFVIPAQSPGKLRGAFDTRSDHRLVMAGALLALLFGQIELTAPWSVQKSYPSFWDDARRAGWTLEV